MSPAAQRAGYSGLQKSVLNCYRLVLRAARTRPEDQQGAIKTFARQEFERYRHADGRDIQLVEHLLRKAKRQVALMTADDVTGVSLRG